MVIVMYGYELSGHNHDVVYETGAEQFTDFDTNMVGYFHDDDNNAWLGYVVAIVSDESFEYSSFDIGAMIILQAQQRIKEIYRQYFSEVELKQTTPLLHIIQNFN